jgi:hypothetical protein
MRREMDLPMGGAAGEPQWLAAQDGFLWEYALELYLGGMPLDTAMDVAFKRHMVMARTGVTKQITTVLDDIHMTPDGYDPATKALESYKRTKLSAKNALSVEAWVAKFGLWMVQEGSYWHALEAAGYEIDSIRWYVYWVNGDYSRQAGKGQFVGIYEAKLTKSEREDVWARVLRMRMKMANKDTEKTV